MTQITTLGIDLAKRVFAPHGVVGRRTGRLPCGVNLVLFLF